MKSFFTVIKQNRFGETAINTYSEESVAQKVADLSNAIYNNQDSSDETYSTQDEGFTFFSIVKTETLDDVSTYVDFYIVNNIVEGTYNISFVGVGGKRFSPKVSAVSDETFSGWVSVPLDTKEAMKENALKLFKDTVKDLTKN